MSSSSLFAEFLARLGRDATVTSTADGLVVAAWSGTRFDPPIRLVVDEASLTELAADLGGSAVEVFPGSDPSTAALQLLLANLEEELDCRPDDSTTLVIGPAGIRWSD